MNFETFSARSEQIFTEIPLDFREGVDGIEVTRATVAHPTLPEVYTLGECLSEFYPSEFGGAGEVRSRVVLYYGSFLALSRVDEGWDWEGELWETITHEVRHHLEHLASEDALEEQDYAADQNFLRRDGEPFDPFFFRAGESHGRSLYEVDRDFFIEVEVEGGAGGEPIDVRWAGHDLRVPLPDELADVHYLRIEDPPAAPDGDLYVVVVRRKRASEWLRRLFRARKLQVTDTDVRLEAE